MLEVQGLAKRFGEFVALEDVSFHVEPGEIVGLVGPNGAGKTTLLEILCALIPAENGRIYWQSHDVPPEQRRELMFYVPDGIQPWPDHKTARVLDFFEKTFGGTTARTRDVVKGLGLEPILDKRVGVLSKGFRRRLLIGIGLLSPHPLLIMDEPFDGLDVRQTRDVADLLRTTAGPRRSLLLSIHQLVDAERICDRLVLLSGGRVRGEGTLATLKAKAGITTGNLEEVFLALT